MADLSLVTAERNHLVEIAGTLVKGLGAEYLQDAKKPVVISVRGSMWSGKKIFSDRAVETVFGIPDARKHEEYRKNPSVAARPHFKGKYGYDEYWKGKSGGFPVEIMYLDAAYGAGYEKIKSGHRNGMAGIVKEFLSLRRCGGVTFLQNGWGCVSAHSPDINIWLESPHSMLVEGGIVRKSETAPRQLRRAFNEAGWNPWVRYVEIDVGSDALKRSPQFAQALESIRSRGPVFR